MKENTMLELQIRKSSTLGVIHFDFKNGVKVEIPSQDILKNVNESTNLIEVIMSIFKRIACLCFL